MYLFPPKPMGGRNKSNLNEQSINFKTTLNTHENRKNQLFRLTHGCIVSMYIHLEDRRIFPMNLLPTIYGYLYSHKNVLERVCFTTFSTLIFHKANFFYIEYHTLKSVYPLNIHAQSPPIIKTWCQCNPFTLQGIHFF